MRSRIGATPTIEAKIEAHRRPFRGKAQLPDGYLNCWYLGREPENRWTNLRDNHELYNAGHMLEGAIAYFQATGRRQCLDIMEALRRPHPRDLRPRPRPEARLSRTPGNRAGADQALPPDRRQANTSISATYFINERGQQPPHYFDIEADRPRRRSRTTTGPRPMNTASRTSRCASRTRSSATPCAPCTCTPPWPTSPPSSTTPASSAPARRCGSDVIETKMYVTAGLGPAAANEGFTHDFDLPNDTAYAETCASVALIFWAQRMLHLDLDGQYADVLEHGALQRRAVRASAATASTISTPTRWRATAATALGLAHLPVLHDERVAGWSPRSAAISSRIATTASPSISMAASRPPSPLKSGKVAVRETSNYPWSGEIKISDRPGGARRLHREAAHSRLVQGLERHGQRRAGRRPARRQRLCDRRPGPGSKGDAIALDLPMPAERIYAHPQCAWTSAAWR